MGKTQWRPHIANIDLRDQVGLLNQLGSEEATDIAGPRALTEMSCALNNA